MPIHIKASPSDIASNIIAVGDPERVDLLSQVLLQDAKIVNIHRGFKIVTGYYKDSKITIAAHGIGAPSAAIVFEELYQLGAKRIVRLGTTGSLRKDLRVGDIVVASGAMYPIGGCGLAQYIPGLCGASSPHPILTYRIMKTLEELNIEFKYGPVFSSDAFYTEDKDFAEKLSKYGVLSVEMEAAVLFILGWIRGFEAACVLVTSNTLYDSVFPMVEHLTEKLITVGKAIVEMFNKYYK
ncbi:MAG: purine-nucleoside phosphorylase [Desulfurococcaceae archaeon]